MRICKTYYQFRFLDLSGSSSCHRSQDSKQEKYRRKNSFLLPLWRADRASRVVNADAAGLLGFHWLDLGIAGAQWQLRSLQFYRWLRLRLLSSATEAELTMLAIKFTMVQKDGF
ncbi:hypothetical protein MUK42_28109 [Musa troglodytarum]|uniref:Uncharacterized protein n=1 Tax=Musa troglodytarum TaxID=320322 RepID=A0A9E7K8W8_9LILI|nr:hypothetical protein MUK42_28109 [Musa troglodytarum]